MENVVEGALDDDPRCGAANWSEVVQRVVAAGRDWDLVRALLFSYEIQVDPVLAEDGEWAALRWIKGEGLSLADRVDSTVLTADSAWGSAGRIKQIR